MKIKIFKGNFTSSWLDQKFTLQRKILITSSIARVSHVIKIGALLLYNFSTKCIFTHIQEIVICKNL